MPLIRDNRHSVKLHQRLVQRIRLHNFMQKSDPHGFSGIEYFGGLKIAPRSALADAVKKAGSTDVEAVATALRDGSYETVLGAIAFNDKGDVKEPKYVMYVWKDGNYGEL